MSVNVRGDTPTMIQPLAKHAGALQDLLGRCHESNPPQMRAAYRDHNRSVGISKASLAFFIFVAVYLSGADGSLLAASTPGPQLSWEPPALMTPEVLPNPNGSDDMIAALRIGDTNVTLEKTPLASLQSLFGGTIGHRGDAGDSLSWLCLGGSNSGKSWVLWLESGEIDGDTVGGFRWEAINPGTQLDHRCGQVRAPTGVELPLPLQPGTSQSDLLRTLGAPAARKEGRLLFIHEHEMSLNSESYTATNSISVLLRKGSVWAIEVWKSTVS
jgi:hypothetical protein